MAGIGQNTEMYEFKPDEKFMVLYASDDAVDIAINEVSKDRILKQEHSESVQAIKIDDSFQQLLIKIFGLTVFSQFQEDFPESCQELFRYLRDKIKNEELNDKKNVSLKIPVELMDMFEKINACNIKESIGKTEMSDSVTVVGDKLRICASWFKQFVFNAISGTIQNVRTILNYPKYKTTQIILIAGNIGDVIQRVLRTHFPNHKCVSFSDVGLFVSKGAVVYSCNPTIMSKQIASDTGQNNHLIVAAIDFGTTFSGWAYCKRHDYNPDSPQILVRTWNDGRNISPKAPTTVLISPDGKKLEAFGYEAEYRYTELVADDEHRDYYYFTRFKMTLHSEKNLTRNTILKDDKGRTLPAMKVFSMVIAYLKNDMMGPCQKTLAEGHFNDNDVLWVITVPAIWNEPAKQFMRECAILAGITNDNLMIALEPEAASLYCRRLPIDKFVTQNIESGITSFKPGAKYMILDSGGGTVDISVHEVNEDMTLKELYHASGGAYGGIKVDAAFLDMLEGIFGKEVLRRFQEESLDDYMDLTRDFEVKKRTISPTSDSKISLRIPSVLTDLYKKINRMPWTKALTKMTISKHSKVVGEKLRIDACVYRDLFASAINGIVEHVQTLEKLPELDDVKTILMIGGFSESKILQHAVNNRFPTFQLVIPEEASVAVIKGAVMYGFDPAGISQRICKFTYGIESTDAFISSEHDPNKKITGDKGMLFCTNVFSKHVEIGQVVKYGFVQDTCSISPFTEIQTKIKIKLFASNNKNVRYTDEPECRQLGSVDVDIRDMSVPRDLRTVYVSFCFSGTEIDVKAVEARTGEVTKTKVEFLG